MYKILVVPLLALNAGSAIAQANPQQTPSSTQDSLPGVAYESAFKGYRPYVDPEPTRWREANDEMGRLNGHVGHLPGSVPPRGASGNPKPPAHAGHGSVK